MGIQHNIDDLVVALDGAPQDFVNVVLKPLARTTDQHFVRISTQQYMQSGPTTFEERPPPRPAGLSGPLRKVSLRLSRAVQGDFTYNGSGGSRESTTELKVTPEGLKWSRKIDVPYARIHEKGGRFTVPVTSGGSGTTEAAMWALYYRTGEERYKSFALATKKRDRFTIVIPARPYLEPALRDTLPIVVKEAERRLSQFLELYFD